MEVIELTMFEHLAERQQEVAFSTILLLSVCLAFGAVEGSARLYAAKLKANDVDWSSLTSSAGQVSADAKYPRFKPNSRFGHLTFNSLGYRSPELATPKPARSVRVAFLGDSVMFGAEFTEENTIPAATTRLLAQAHPKCRFEYVTIAGPSYPMNFLAGLWTDSAPTIRPDVAVVLAGNAIEMIREHDAAAEAKDRLLPVAATRSASAWKPRSEFLALVNRQIAIMSPVAAISQGLEIKWQDMSASFDRMSARLVDSLKGTPVLALGYRSLLRSTQPPEKQKMASRHVRAAVPGLTVSQAAALSEFVVAQMERVATSAGWEFNDILKDVPGTREFYRDFTHLSARGTARVAEQTAAWIGTFITEDCQIRTR